MSLIETVEQLLREDRTAHEIEDAANEPKAKSTFPTGPIVLTDEQMRAMDDMMEAFP
jgi:hypothetical protein